jgi:hypothetical protein
MPVSERRLHVDVKTDIAIVTFVRKERVCRRVCSLAHAGAADHERASGGRPRRLTDKDTAAAKAMLADGALTSKEVAARFGVSKAAPYRYLG